jgi:Phytanoyl-CoA dioxygenase (PhyH)
VTRDHLAALDRDGFSLLRGAFSPADCDRLLAEWEAACATDGAGVMRSAAGAVYGARNILDLWPNALQVMHQPGLSDAVRAVLGPEFGLVRILYFDKPPGESWALPWHKDLAVAVKDNRLRSEEFGRPTTKYGVPHVEAPAGLLERMLTARLHLDEVTEENGPLRVLPGSHRDGKGASTAGNEVRVLCGRGDVLLMRPLLSHCSGHSREGTTRHRRTLHLEFSAVRDLPDGYQWHTFNAPADARERGD